MLDFSKVSDGIRALKALKCAMKIIKLELNSYVQSLFKRILLAATSRRTCNSVRL